MCIQKLFIHIEMMYSGIKLMVFCIVYQFRMRVNALNSRSREKSHHPCSGALIIFTLWLRLCYRQVWLVDLVVSLQTSDRMVWCLEFHPVLCIF